MVLLDTPLLRGPNPHPQLQVALQAPFWAAERDDVDRPRLAMMELGPSGTANAEAWRFFSSTQLEKAVLEGLRGPLRLTKKAWPRPGSPEYART